jgi:nitrous oxidase accessory protein
LKRTVSIIVLTIFAVSILAVSNNIKKVNAEEITVPDDFSTIQEAINNANEGDIIFVRNGTYYEHVIVNKTVSLVGECNVETILDGLGSSNCVDIKANNVTMSGFTVRNCSYNAIGIWDYNNATLTCNILTNSNIGVFIANGQNVTVGNNTLANGTCGIMCAGSCRCNTISQNTLRYCVVGIDVHAVIGPTVIESNLIQSSIGIGIWMSDAPNTYVFTNSVTGSGEENMLIQYCPNSEIYANLIASSKCGMRIGYSENKSIYHNNFINNVVQAEFLANGTAIWDERGEGNYWSDYNGTDSNHDGIGDVPYIINSNNTDLYPLINPYWSPADINHDLKVDILDVVTIAAYYHSTSSSSWWNPHADIAQPYGKIDLLDVVKCTGHYGEKYH